MLNSLKELNFCLDFWGRKNEVLFFDQNTKVIKEVR